MMATKGDIFGPLGWIWTDRKQINGCFTIYQFRITGTSGLAVPFVTEHKIRKDVSPETRKDLIYYLAVEFFRTGNFLANSVENLLVITFLLSFCLDLIAYVACLLGQSLR